MNAQFDSPLPIGATQSLLTESLQIKLDLHSESYEWISTEIDDAEVTERLSRHVGQVVARRLSSISDASQRVAAVHQIMEILNDSQETPLDPPTEITGILPRGQVTGREVVTVRPQSPFNDAALLTNASYDPSLNSELRAEIASANRIDLLCAFLKWQGLRLLEKELRDFSNRGGKMRVITTTYIGATQRQAIDRLIDEFGADVRVQYDIERTRLHAKSWYFHRDSGWDTAYVGSSNLSRAALLDGVEWNVRLSRQQTGPLLAKFRHTFESYWNDPTYQKYDPLVDADRLDRALNLASGKALNDAGITEISGLDVHPYPHQEKVLERLKVEREIHGRHQNLVVAATGTGKTVMAALDYRDGAQPLGEKKSLLFVAHRIELLEQARRTFRGVLKDGSFGEILGGGHVPSKWRYVFATVQSLSAWLERLDSDQFDMIIVDEFHHSEASTYRKVLKFFKPKELLGLTATPERADGVDVRAFFGGRTASEIRLWDALKADLLSPFHYFSISDNTDLTNLQWRRGRYDPSQLEQLYIGNDSRSSIILRQVKDKIVDPRNMKALGFCVSVTHAEYMARVFTDAGLPSQAVTSITSEEGRRQALRCLAEGELCALFTVDLFNEGIDLPSIDTVLFLRPTESATVFIQQLGRGLRKERNKSVLTALDFVGMQRKEFRFESKFKAMTGLGRMAVLDGVRYGFSYLPAGTEISLDETSQQDILDHLKRQVSPRWAQIASELHDFGQQNPHVKLTDYLESSGYDLSDVLKSKSKNWTALRSRAGLTVLRQGPRHEEIVGRGRALAHVDDMDRLRVYRMVLAGGLSRLADLPEADRTLARMLLFSIWPTLGGMKSADEMLLALRQEPAACAEFLEVLEVAEERISHVSVKLEGRLSDESIRAHAHYSREEIVTAMKYASFERRPDSLREGVFYSRPLKSDVFLVTLKKNAKNYSPTTMYNDVAISPTLFHWESQSTTSAESVVGNRYINHKSFGSEVVIFVRPEKASDLGIAAPYFCLGTVDYLRHEGSRPIAFDWRLRTPMPGDFYAVASVD